MQNVTLDSSDGGFNYPAYGRRRRPIRSRTRDALFRLLSHFRSNFNQQRSQDGDDDAVLQLASKEREPVVVNVTDAGCSLERPPDLRESAGEPLPPAVCGKNEGIGNLWEISVEGKEPVFPISDHGNGLNGNKDDALSNKTGELEVPVVETQATDSVPEVVKSEENLCSILEIQMDEFGIFEEFPADDKLFTGDFPEVLRSCMDIDMGVKFSKVGVEANGAGSMTENMHNEVENALKMKEMELEKLICTSSGLTSSSHPNSNEEVEEGEISGNSGDENAPLDSLSEDLPLAGERPGYMLLASGEKNVLLHDQEDAGGKNDNVKFGTSPDQKEFLSSTALSNSVMGTQDGEARKKKRKRPSLEQKARKKKKERMKRAEKNREAGVKRLKLPPVVKTKAKEICRHYQKGRCSEGDNCNFSHDTVPLTKSKPCCHFARNSCMKGDDCPYDHQLSKYPCTNYATHGFCSRGANCLFSHQSTSQAPTTATPESSVAQNTEKGRSSIISNVTRTDTKFPSPVTTASHQKFAVNLVNRRIGLTTAKSPLSTPPQLPSVTPPKMPSGFSFPSRDKENALSIRPSDTPGSSAKPITENAGSTDKLNEKVVPRIPRGINFLSFTKNSPDDLNSKVLSTMLPSTSQGKGKSVKDYDTTLQEKPICTSSQSNMIMPIETPTPSMAASAARTLDRTPPHGSLIKQGNNPTSTELLSANFTSPSWMQKTISSTLAFATNLEASRSSLGHQTG